MRRSQVNQSKQPLGRLKTLIVISNWVSFLNTGSKRLYKNQEVQSINNSSVIFIPVDFSRIIKDNVSHLLLYGAGIYWTKFAIFKQTITTDHRFLTGLLVPEERWLDNHFNTEPFSFPPSNDFIMGDYLKEFPFNALKRQDEISGHTHRAFSRGIILVQLVFPFKEPLMMLKKATESYENFDSPNAPMRILISEFGNIENKISLESNIQGYQESIPGINSIETDLLNIFPEKWSNEVYLQGLRREIANLSKDFAFIGAPLILN
ncbi:MAG: hypothetical protein ACW98X_25210 [Promethearchaeota archaeon]|jgi:hypothetical protein